MKTKIGLFLLALLVQVSAHAGAIKPWDCKNERPNSAEVHLKIYWDFFGNGPLNTKVEGTYNGQTVSFVTDVDKDDTDGFDIRKFGYSHEFNVGFKDPNSEMFIILGTPDLAGMQDPFSGADFRPEGLKGTKIPLLCEVPNH